MGSVSNEIIYRRLSDTINSSIELAKAADAEMLVYLFEMAYLELRVLRNKADPDQEDTFVSMKTGTQRIDVDKVDKIFHSLGELLRKSV